MTDTIDAIHIWLMVHPDGTETIVSGDLPIGEGLRRHMPFMSSKRETAERMQRSAEQVIRMGGVPGAKAVLVSFARIKP